MAICVGVYDSSLRRLHFALGAFYRQEGIVPRTYREILWGWFVKNRAPHTNWDLAAQGSSDLPHASSVAAH